MSNTIDNESLSFVFKKLQGYPNTDIGLEYNLEPNNRNNYYKIFLNQVYAKKIPELPPSDLSNLLLDPFNETDDDNNALFKSKTGKTSTIDNNFKFFYFIELEKYPIAAENPIDSDYVYYARDDEDKFILRDFIPINFGETWRPKIMKVHDTTGVITEIFPNTVGNEWLIDKDFGMVKFFKKNFNLEANHKLYMTGYKYIGGTIQNNISTDSSSGGGGGGGVAQALTSVNYLFGVRYLSEKWADAYSTQNYENSREYTKGWLFPFFAGTSIWSSTTFNNGFPGLFETEMGYVPIPQNVKLQKIIWKSDESFTFSIRIHRLDKSKIGESGYNSPDYGIISTFDVTEGLGHIIFTEYIPFSEGTYLGLEIYNIVNTSGDLNKSVINFDESFPCLINAYLQEDNDNNFSLQ